MWFVRQMRRHGAKAWEVPCHEGPVNADLKDMSCHITGTSTEFCLLLPACLWDMYCSSLPAYLLFSCLAYHCYLRFCLRMKPSALWAESVQDCVAWAVNESFWWLSPSPWARCRMKYRNNSHFSQGNMESQCNEGVKDPLKQLLFFQVTYELTLIFANNTVFNILPKQKTKERYILTSFVIFCNKWSKQVIYSMSGRRYFLPTIEQHIQICFYKKNFDKKNH